jgi:uncharacterized protein (TIGR03118 family)
MSEARTTAGTRPARGWPAALVTLAMGATLAVIPATHAGAHGTGAPDGNAYEQTNLVSDIPGAARLADPHLINPWGLAFGPTTPAWVADNGADVATLYRGGFDRNPPQTVPLVVSIPGGAPTGQVFNGGDGFVVGDGPTAGPARFIFDSEAGTITAWSPTLSPNTAAVTVVPAEKTNGAIFKGLTIATGKRGTMLYAADFHNAKIDVYDTKFAAVSLRPGAFTDPNLPAGFAPFNVQEINGRVYVAYAMQDADAEDEVAGPGLGYVDVYTPNGKLVTRLISGGDLNAPWGLALAPKGFGAFAGSLLVGNFGDGKIHAYDPQTGEARGALQYEDGSEVAINGLWALRFGNGVIGDPETLLFTAGIDDEAHGLFGSLTPAD